jgi:D-alanine-D-alanine ligase
LDSPKNHLDTGLHYNHRVAEKLRIGILTTLRASPDKLWVSQEEITADEIVSTLLAGGHDVVRLGGVSTLVESLEEARAGLDLVFNLDPDLEAAVLLDWAGLPTTGSPPAVLGLANHRLAAKIEVERAGVATPDAVVVPGPDDQRLESLPYPALVKPLVRRRPGTEVSGASQVENAEAARLQARRLADEGRGPALVETLVRGIEVQVPLLATPEPRALGVSAVAIEEQPLDGDAILGPDVLEHRLVEPPSRVDQPRVRKAACQVAKTLGLRDYGRIDLRIDADGTPWFLAAHPAPDLGSTGAFGRVGPLARVVEEIVRAAVLRSQRN